MKNVHILLRKTIYTYAESNRPGPMEEFLSENHYHAIYFLSV